MRATSTPASRVRLAVLAVGGAGAIALACSVDGPVGPGRVAGDAEAVVAAAAADSVSTGPQAYFEFQVEKPATVRPGGAPAYPHILREAGVTGECIVSFVVNADGRAEAENVRVLSCAHPLFGVAIRVALPRMQFNPGEIGGRPVRQVVQVPFSFTLGG